MKFSYVYIVASQKRGTLYTGVTSDMAVRAWEHRTGARPGFSARYRCRRLVWFETFNDIAEAIAKEKRIKRWRRVWKFRLIEEGNPDWRDLYFDLWPAAGTATTPPAVIPDAKRAGIHGA